MKNYIILLCFIFNIFSVSSQYKRQHQKLESLYIQTNKDIYTSGEEIKFKVTVLNSKTLKPSYTSKILYLQILNINKEVEFSHKFPIDRGVCKGVYKLKDNFKNGLYFLNVMTVHSINKNLNIRAQKPFHIEQNFYKRLHIAYDLVSDSVSNQLLANFKVYDRKYKPYKKLKTQLVYKTKSGKNKKQRIKTNDKGIVVFKLKNVSDIDFSRLVFTVFDDSGKREEIISLPSPNFNNKFNVQFFPEGGQLFSGIEQKVAVKIINEWNEPVKSKVFLYEEEKKLQELDLQEKGIAAFTYNFKRDKKYFIKSRVSNKEYSIPFPEFTNAGVYLKVIEKGKTLKVDLFPINLRNDKNFKVKAYNNGEVIHQKVITSLQNLTSFPIHVQDLSSGVVFVELLDVNNNVLASRDVFVNQHKKLYVKPLKTIRRRYKPKEKIKLRFKVSDHLKKNKRAVATIRISNDKSVLLENGMNLSSYYQLIKNSNERIVSSGKYFSQKSPWILDDLMLTKTYIRNDSNYKKHAKSYQESIFGKLYGRGLANNLIAERNKRIPVIAGVNNNSIIVDSLGNFKISPSKLEQINSEYFTVAYGNSDSHYITKSDFLLVSEEFQKMDFINISNNISFLSRKKISKKYSEDFSFDYSNSLDEVVVTKKVKNVKAFGVKKLHEGSVFDYVCYEYDILNCVNHKQGYKPVEGGIYLINGGEKIVYKAPKSKSKTKEKLESNILKLKGFYNYNKKQKVEGFQDLRTNLYWNPYLLNNKKGEFEIEFTTSEVRGIYQASIEVNSQDGLLGTYFFTFEVK